MSHKVWVSYTYPYSSGEMMRDAKWRYDNFGRKATTGEHYGRDRVSITLHVSPEEAALVILKHETAKVLDLPAQEL